MPTQMSITDKIRCIAREIALRKSVYPKRVKEAKMSEHEAAYQIEVMEAILADYQTIARAEQKSAATTPHG